MGIGDIFQLYGINGIGVVAVTVIAYALMEFVKHYRTDQKDRQKESVDMERVNAEVADQLRDDLQNELIELRGEVRLLKEELDSWRDKYATLNAAHEILRQQHGAVKTENQRLRKENRALRDFIFSIRDTIDNHKLKELLDGIEPISE